jgi:Tannase and feruloyl esterase
VNAKYPFLNAMATDYRAFQSRGGKLIMYTDLADPVTPPLDTFAYCESVAKAMGGTNGQVDRTHSLRASPAVAHYHGAGSIDDAANFSCVVR